MRGSASTQAKERTFRAKCRPIMRLLFLEPSARELARRRVRDVHSLLILGSTDDTGHDLATKVQALSALERIDFLCSLYQVHAQRGRWYTHEQPPNSSAEGTWAIKGLAKGENLVNIDDDLGTSRIWMTKFSALKMVVGRRTISTSTCIARGMSLALAGVVA